MFEIENAPVCPLSPQPWALSNSVYQKSGSNTPKYKDLVQLCISQHFALDKHNAWVPTENVLDKNSIYTDSEL